MAKTRNLVWARRPINSAVERIGAPCGGMGSLGDVPRPGSELLRFRA